MLWLLLYDGMRIEAKAWELPCFRLPSSSLTSSRQFHLRSAASRRAFDIAVAWC